MKNSPGHVPASLEHSAMAWCWILLLLPLSVSAYGQVSVVTWHYNNGRTGANTQETILTPANVRSTQTFGKLFSQPVDGLIVGQPLYLPHVTIAGKGVHNVVYVATNHDTVYAFDADSATGPNAQPLWKTSILTYSPPGAEPVPITVTGGHNDTGFDEHGIISTPVIDPATNTMYLVADTYEEPDVVHRLHALDVRTGHEVLGGPTTIAATYTLNEEVTTFQPQYQMQRPGLLLANGHIYVGFGSNCCNRPPTQGWIMSYNKSTLQQEGAYTVEPGLLYAAIWQHGAALSADSSGHIYGGTGEGPYVAGSNLSETVFKLTQSGTQLGLTDWFTPCNHQTLSTNDVDMADGALVIPDHAGPYPRELVAASKGPTIYVLNRDNMGQLSHDCTTSDPQIIQEFGLPFGEPGSPAFWNNTVYFTPQISPIQAYALNPSTGLLSLAAQSDSMPGGGHPFITSNGTSNGILWTTNGNSVFALDIGTLQTIYNTNQAVNQRDKLPVLAHFPAPIVANGKLFVGTTSSLVVYGLVPALTPTGGSGQTGAVATVLPTALQVQVSDRYTGAGLSGVSVTFSDGGRGGSFSNPVGRTDATGTIATTYTLPRKSGAYTVTASVTGAGYKTASLPETAVAGPATAMFKGGGNFQTAPVVTTLPVPISVIAKDQYSNVVPGVSVTFSDGGAGGHFSTNPVITNAQGLASVSYTTSTRAGQVAITASASGVPNNVFYETVTAGPANAIAVRSGNNQTGPVSTPLPRPLVSQVTDRFGNPERGVSVTYSDSGRGGSFSPNPVTTDIQGNASVSYTTPPRAGTITIQATVSGVSTPATFTETAR